MIQLKSKKTGRESIYSEEEYASILKKGVIDIKKFIVTEIRSRPIIPSMKVPVEVSNLPNKKK